MDALGAMAVAREEGRKMTILFFFLPEVLST